MNWTPFTIWLKFSIKRVDFFPSIEYLLYRVGSSHWLFSNCFAYKWCHTRPNFVSRSLPLHLVNGGDPDSFLCIPWHRNPLWRPIPKPIFLYRLNDTVPSLRHRRTGIKKERVVIRSSLNVHSTWVGLWTSVSSHFYDRSHQSEGPVSVTETPRLLLISRIGHFVNCD